MRKAVSFFVCLIVLGSAFLAACSPGVETVTVTVPVTTTSVVTVPADCPPPTTVTAPAASVSHTYYLKNGGDDSSSGLSDTEAWATLSKVQNSRFEPGDTILLKCGDIWNERLEFPSSGNATSDILFSSYGSGEQPTMMGLFITSKEHVTVSNIYLLADITYQSLMVRNSNDLVFDGITADGQRIMSVRRIDALEMTVFFYSYNVVIKNSTIKNGGDYYANSDYGGGLGIDHACHDFLVENNLIYNQAGFGIQTGPWDHSPPAYNITIRGNTIYNEEGYHDDCRGINVGWDSHDILIENNTVSNMKTMLIGTDADEHDVIIRNNLLFYTLDDGVASFINILSMSAGENHHTQVYNNSMFHLSKTAGGAFFEINTVDSVPNTGHEFFNNLCVTYNPAVAFISDQSWDENNPDPLRSEFTSDYNLFYSLVPPGTFEYRNVKYDSIEDWRRVSGQDLHTIYANPLLPGLETYDDGMADTTTGAELITNPSLDSTSNGWVCYFDGGLGASGSIDRTSADGEYASGPAGLVISAETSGTGFNSIQLSNTAGVPMESGRWYILSFKAKATSGFRMPDLHLTQMQAPFGSYYSVKRASNPVITTEWQTFRVYFYTSQAAGEAKITWYLGGALPSGEKFYLDDVSFKLADGLNNLVLPEISDFIPTGNSPCIDSGYTLAEITDDFPGNPRPRGAGYDIGAYELQSEETPGTSQTFADTVFLNGQVVTMASSILRAEALAVLGTGILAVGSNDEVRGYVGPATEVYDLQGKTLLPGFVDPHTHLFNDAGVTDGWFHRAQEIALSQGITTVGDMFIDPHYLPMIQEFADQGNLDIRTSLYLVYNTNCGAFPAELGTWYQAYQPNRDPSSMLRILGVKVFTDGGSCYRPAFSMELPPEARIDGANGDLFVDEAQLTDIIKKAQEAGFQVAIHAMGDLGIDTALNALGAALDGEPNTYRHRIEHNTFIRPDQLARYGEIDPVVTLFPPLSFFLTTPEWYWSGFLELHGPSVYSWTQPYRSLLDANPGLHVAWHSDWPNNEWTPITALWGMATMQQVTPDGIHVYTPPSWLTDEAVTVEEMLRMMTIDAAYALFMEDKVGSLEPGKFADVIVLSDNPLSVDVNAIRDIKILLTMVGGEVKYSVPDLDPDNIAGSVSGYVYRADGVTPIPGAEVKVLDSALWGRGWMYHGTAVTDDDGYYQINGLPTGVYFAVAGAGGSGYANEIYEEQATADNRTALYVKPGVNVQNINFTLETGGSITGRVTTLDNGVTVPVAGVYILGTNTLTGHWGDAWTDSDGRFTIAVSPGEYRVAALPGTRGLNYQPQYYNLAVYRDQASLASVALEQETQGIDFIIYPVVFPDG